MGPVPHMAMAANAATAKSFILILVLPSPLFGSSAGRGQTGTAGRTLLASKRRRNAAARLLYVAGVPADAHADKAPGGWAEQPAGRQPDMRLLQDAAARLARLRFAGDREHHIHAARRLGREHNAVRPG